MSGATAAAADSDSSEEPTTIDPINILYDDQPKKVTVSHIESPSLFYVYYHVKNYHLDKELNIFMSQYKSCFRFTEQYPTPGTFCACCYSGDEKWYRAIVVESYLEVDDTTKEERLSFTVFFCDYGNSESVYWSEDRIFKLPEYFASMAYMQAIPCAQYGVQPKNADGWSEEEIKKFNDVVSDITNNFQSQVLCKFYSAPRLSGDYENTLVFVDMRPLVSGQRPPTTRDRVSGIFNKWKVVSDVLRPDQRLIKASLPEYMTLLQLIRFARPLPESEREFMKASSEETTPDRAPVVGRSVVKEDTATEDFSWRGATALPSKSLSTSFQKSHRKPSDPALRPKLNVHVLHNAVLRHLGYKYSKASSSPDTRASGQAASRKSVPSKKSGQEAPKAAKTERKREVESVKEVTKRTPVSSKGDIVDARKSDKNDAKQEERRAEKTVEEKPKTPSSDKEEDEDDDSSDDDEDGDGSGAGSPTTTLACQPPPLRTDYPGGTVKIKSRFAGIPDLILPRSKENLYSVIISHIKDPNHFFVNVCSEDTGEMMLWMEKALNYHYEWYSSCMIKRIFDGYVPAVDDIVCAEYKDFFARAIVRDIREVGKNSKKFVLRLHYIDFGYEEDNIPITKVHVLSPQYFYQVPAQAVECSLFGVEPLNKEWSKNAREIFMSACGIDETKEENTKGMTIHVPALSVTKDQAMDVPLSVLLTRGDGELINQLVCLGENPIAKMVGVLADEVDEGYDGDIQPNADFTDEDWNVTESIYTQSLASRADKMKTMKSKTHVVCQYYKVRGRCIWGNHCRFLHTKEDFGDERVNVEFERNVDEFESVTYLNTGDFMPYPAKGAWVGIQVTALYQPNRFYAQLIHGPTDYLDRPHMTKEFSENVLFSDLSQLTDNMNVFYNDQVPLDLRNQLFAVGQVVAVRGKDDNWYRASVLDHDSDSDEVLVKFLDTGDVESIFQGWVRPLKPQFLKGLPVQAFECLLTSIEAPKEGWNKKALKLIAAHVDGQPLHARVDHILPSGILSLTVWDTYKRSLAAYTCLNDTLVRNGYAVRTSTPDDKEDSNSNSRAWVSPDDPDQMYYPG